MKSFNNTLTGLTAVFIAASSSAFAAAHSGFDVTTARADVAFDTNGDGSVSDDELIDGHIAVFDVDGNGTLTAQERGIAEDLVALGGMIEPQMATDSMAAIASGPELDLNGARLDVSLDTNGDGMVDDDEIIDGNMAFFDTDGNGNLDAEERGNATQAVMSGATATAELPGVDTMAVDPLKGLNVNAARLDVSLDTNGDGTVSNDEIIEGNTAIFDTDGNGNLDAQERGVAEQALNNV